MCCEGKRRRQSTRVETRNIFVNMFILKKMSLGILVFHLKYSVHIKHFFFLKNTLYVYLRVATLPLYL